MLVRNDAVLWDNGKAEVSDHLGATSSQCSLQFELKADQTVLTALLQILKI